LTKEEGKYFNQIPGKGHSSVRRMKKGKNYNKEGKEGKRMAIGKSGKEREWLEGLDLNFSRER
jgi:hypothetical protein